MDVKNSQHKIKITTYRRSARFWRVQYQDGKSGEQCEYYHLQIQCVARSIASYSSTSCHKPEKMFRSREDQKRLNSAFGRYTSKRNLEQCEAVVRLCVICVMHTFVTTGQGQIRLDD